jgi:hypothetical protein
MRKIEESRGKFHVPGFVLRVFLTEL